MKKVLSVFLSLLLIVSTFMAIPFKVFADELTNGQCGENINYEFDSDTGTLTLTGSGNMYNYNWSNNSPFCGNESIEHVIVNDGINDIDFAFTDCVNLKTVQLPNSVRPKSINDDSYTATFYGCSSLEEIELSSGIYSLGDYAFENCTSLKEIAVPSGTTHVGSKAFSDCTSLEKVELPDTLTSIYSMAFKNCATLTEIEIPDNVVTVGDYLFSGCEKLLHVKLPANMQKIVNSSFSDCNSLEEIEIPESVTEIEDYAFKFCSSLKSINIPKNVNSISNDAFYSCPAISSISVSPENTVYDSRNNCNAIIESETNTLFLGCKNTVIPNGITKIGDYALAGCENSSGLIIIPEGVAEIGNGAFFNVRDTYIALPKSVTKIGASAFSCIYILYEGTEEEWNNIDKGGIYATVCYNSDYNHLDEAGIKGECGDNLTYTIRVISKTMIIEGTGPMSDFGWGIAQEYNSEITELILSDGITTIGASAFYYYQNLKSNVTIPASVTEIGLGAFQGSGITGITVLNPKCVLEYDYPAYNEGIIPEAATIYGYDNSTAQKYAENYNREFVSLGNYCEINGHSYQDGYCTICDGKDPEYVMPSVTAPSTNTVSVAAGKSYYATFTPNANGTLEFYSEGDDDTYGYIYDSNMNSLDSNDDDGDGSNFKITYEVQKGVTYVLSCRFYNEAEEGNIKFKVEFEEAPHIHAYTKVVTKEPTCTEQGYTTRVCECGDSIIDEESYVNALGHNPVTDKAVSATCGKDGKTAGSHCSVCGEILTAQKVVKATGKHKLNAGKITKQPTFTATGVMTYTCTVCGKTTTASVNKLVSPNLSKLKAGKKSFTAAWKKAPSVNGYEIQYATNTKFKKAKTITVKKDSTVKTTVKNLTAKKKYYVRIRAYKTINGKKYKSAWSKTKTVTPKK